MKLNIDYKVKFDKPEEEAKKEEIYAGLTANYIEAAVADKHEKGLEGQMRRVWGRIQRKFDEAIDNKTFEVTLEEAEKDFIRLTFKDAKFPPNLAKYINILEAEIENLKEVTPTQA